MNYYGEQKIMNSLPELYLASKSPRRSEILSGLNIPFKQIKSSYEEKLEDVVDLSPQEMAAKLAGFKAFHAASELESGIVIGADTIVVKGDVILGKPKNEDEVRDMLYSLSGKKHKVITGISLVHVEKLRTLTYSEITDVYFRNLDKLDVEQYIATGEPMDKAGAYGIQGYASLFVERIEGCYFNVVGFPVVAFRNLLLNLGFNLVDYINLEEK